MEELIKISEHNGMKAVSARELHQFLEAKERFSSWCKRMFKYGFIENVDYIGCKEFNTLANQELEDYALTIDCAKEISMLQRSEKGKIARQYFIACENKLKEIAAPLSTLDLLELTIKGMRENNQEIQEVKQEVRQLQAQITTRPEYFTVAGYCKLNGIKASTQMCSTLGRQASKYCKEKGYPIDEVPDTRWGKVGSYPREVLEEIFNQPIT